MHFIAIISLIASVLVLDKASQSRLREIQTGHKLSTHMADVENPGSDWLGRWW